MISLFSNNEHKKGIPGSTYKQTFIEELCTVYKSSYLTSSSPNVYIYMIPMFIYIQVSKGLWSVLHSDIHYMLSARINIVIAVEAGCPDEI